MRAVDNHVKKALRLVGMAKRARRVEAGEQPAGRALKSGQGRLALIAEGASQNSRRRLAEWAEAANVTLAVVPCTIEELGSALGMTTCAMAVLTDAGFARAVSETLHGGGTI